MLSKVAAADEERVDEATSAMIFLTFASYMLTPPLFAALSCAAAYQTLF